MQSKQSDSVVTGEATRSTQANPPPDTVGILREEDFTFEPLLQGGLEVRDTRPFDPARERERVRTSLALVLGWTLAGAVLCAFVTLWFLALTDKLSSDDLRNVLTIIFAPLIGVVGTVAGFYFAGRDGD